MAREKMNYREVLSYLLEVFDGKQLLSVSDVSKAFKIAWLTASKRYPFENNKIEITRLASCMCVSQEDIRRAYHR